MTITRKIRVGFVVILALMVVLALVGISRVARINAGSIQIDDVNAVTQRYAINFRGSVHDRSINIWDVVLVCAHYQISRATLYRWGKDKLVVLVAASTAIALPQSPEFGCCSHMRPVLVAASGCCSHMRPVLVAASTAIALPQSPEFGCCSHPAPNLFVGAGITQIPR